MVIKEKYQKEYYRAAYLQLLESIENSESVEERRYYIKKNYYYRGKAGISYEEYQRDRYNRRINGLNKNILVVELLRREALASYRHLNQSPIYRKIESLNSQNRSLYYEVKKVIPNFDNFENFPNYRDSIVAKASNTEISSVRIEKKYKEIKSE